MDWLLIGKWYESELLFSSNTSNFYLFNLLRNSSFDILTFHILMIIVDKNRL